MKKALLAACLVVSVKLMAPASASAVTIVSDAFTNSGGPGSSTAYANGAAIAGHQPDTVNLPGGSYSYLTGSATFAGGIIDTTSGNPAPQFNAGPQATLATSLQSNAGNSYVEPSVLTVSMDEKMNTIAGTDQTFRGIGLGFAALAPTATIDTGNGFYGILVGATTGNLSFDSNGKTSTTITGGTYNSTTLGTYSTSTYYHLAYTLDTATGIVTNLTLSDSTGTESIPSPGAIPSYTTGTGAAGSTANFLVVQSSGNSGAAFGDVDNLQATPEPASLGAVAVVAVAGLLLRRRVA